MTQPNSIRVTEDAARHIREAEVWWRENRTAAPDAIKQELLNAFETLMMFPASGSIANDADLSGVRRVHLSRVRYHLYYNHDESTGTIEILALWHSSRSDGPSL